MHEGVINKIINYFDGTIETLNLDTAEQANYDSNYDLVTGFNFINNYANIIQASKIIFDISKKTQIFLLRAPLSALNYFINYFAYSEIIAEENQGVLVFLSNNFWYANGQITKFDSWTDISHPLAQNSSATRRYYFSSNYLLKYYDFNHVKMSSINMTELKKEIQFLKNPYIAFNNLPQVLDYKLDKKQGWILREKLRGHTLSDVIKSSSYCANQVIHSILTQLSALEEKGLYHGDLRPWNIFILESGQATLIDYGSISDEKINTNIYLNFLILCHEIIHRVNLDCRKYNPNYLLHLENYANYYLWIMKIMSTDPRQWRFTLLLKYFNNIAESEPQIINYAQFKPWLVKINRLIASNKLRLRHFEAIFLAKITGYSQHQLSLKNFLYYLKFFAFVLYDSITLKFKKRTND